MTTPRRGARCGRSLVGRLRSSRAQAPLRRASAAASRDGGAALREGLTAETLARPYLRLGGGGGGGGNQVVTLVAYLRGAAGTTNAECSRFSRGASGAAAVAADARAVAALFNDARAPPFEGGDDDEVPPPRDWDLRGGARLDRRRVQHFGEHSSVTLVDDVASGAEAVRAAASPDEWLAGALPGGWEERLPGRPVALLVVGVVSAADLRASGGLEAFAGADVAGGRPCGPGLELYTAFAPSPVLRAVGALAVFDAEDGGAHLGTERARQVQRFLELEHYRALALLPLMGAKQLQVDITEQEAKLSRLLRIRDDPERRLAELFKLSAECEEAAAASRSALFAAQAYGAVVDGRLERLALRHVDGTRDLHGLVRKRVGPALRTYSACLLGVDGLVSSVARAIALVQAEATLESARTQRALVELGTVVSVISLGLSAAQLLTSSR